MEDELESRLEVLQRYLGDVKIEVEFVSSIDTTPQGKDRFIISEFGQKLLHRENETSQCI